LHVQSAVLGFSKSEYDSCQRHQSANEIAPSKIVSVETIMVADDKVT